MIFKILGQVWNELFGIKSANAALPFYNMPPDPTTVPFSFPVTGNYSSWYRVAQYMDKLYFGGWFAQNDLNRLVAAMVMVESSGGVNRVRIVTARDTSYGPMQVTPYTAKDIYNRGFKTFGYDPLTLIGTKGGMYYGMAYIKILVQTYGKKTTEDIVKSYNGGPGWRGLSAKGISQVTNHWNKVKSYLTIEV